MKRTLGLILVFVLSVICAVSVFADDAPASLSVQASQGQANVGDTITVKLNISAVKPIGKVTATVAYDASVLTFVSGDGAKAENGVITIEQLNGLGTVAAVNLSFTAASQGTGSINVTSCSIYDAFEEKLDLMGTGTSIQVTEVSQTETTTQTEETTSPEETTTTEQSTTAEQTTTTQQTSPETDANGVPTQGVLVDLQIDNGTLKPPFMYSIHEYSVTVPYEVEKVEIEGKTASLQDNIWYTGNAECVVGHNVRTITVTDINGQQTVYTINIIRLDKDQTETIASANDPAIQTSYPAETGKVTQTSKKDKDIKKTLVPALYIVLVVLIVALVIVIIWIKAKASGRDSKEDRSDKKNEKQRSKIKVSGKNNNKKE